MVQPTAMLTTVQEVDEQIDSGKTIADIIDSMTPALTLEWFGKVIEMHKIDFTPTTYIDTFSPTVISGREVECRACAIGTALVGLIGDADAAEALGMGGELDGRLLIDTAVRARWGDEEADRLRWESVGGVSWAVRLAQVSGMTPSWCSDLEMGFCWPDRQQPIYHKDAFNLGVDLHRTYGTGSYRHHWGRHID